MPVGDLHPNPWNPNRQRDVVAKAIRESIEEYGFVDPVTVRPHPDLEGQWQIVNGEHRWKDLQELGHDTVSCVVLPELDEAAARKLTMLLNEGGEPDVVLMGALLTDLKGMQGEDDFLKAMPYTTAELDHLLSLADENWSRFDGERPAPQRPIVERVLSLPYTVGQFDEIAAWLDIVKRELSLPDDASAVHEAVKRLAFELNQNPAAAAAA